MARSQLATRATRKLRVVSYALSASFVLQTGLFSAGCRKNTGIARGPQFVGAGSKTPVHGGVLRISLTDGIRTVDPQVAYDEFSYVVLNHTASSLIGYADALSDKPAELVPELATVVPKPEPRPLVHPESGQPLLDPKTGKPRTGYAYVFPLREGISFYDPAPAAGQPNVRPIKPEHFKYALERALDPDTHCPGQGFFDAIAGATDVISPKDGAPPVKHVWGIQVTGPRELTIMLERPDPTFLYKIAMIFASPIEPETVARYGADGLNQHQVSSGRFYLASYDRGVRAVLKKNPGYWNRDAVYLDGIDIGLMVERQVGFMKFRANEIDLVDRLTAQDLLSIAEQRAWKPYVQKDRTIDVYGKRFDVTMKPFDDKRVRQALNYAINRDHQAQLGYGTMLPARGPIPPDMPGYNPALRSYNYDPVKAKQLLVEAGYPNGFEMDDYILGPDEKAEKIALSRQFDLAKIGVRVNIKRLTFPVHLQMRMAKGQMPFGDDSWIQDFPDQSNFLEFLYHSKYRGDVEAVNSSQYSNPEVDRLLDAAAQELDGDKRRELFHQAEQIIVDDAPWVWEYHSVRVEVRQPWVMHYRIHPVLLRDFRSTWLDLPIRSAQ